MVVGRICVSDFLTSRVFYCKYFVVESVERGACGLCDVRFVALSVGFDWLMGLNIVLVGLVVGIY